MTKLAAIVGWSTILVGLLILRLGSPPAGLALLAALAVACCVIGSHQAREARARAQVDRIIERSRAR